MDEGWRQQLEQRWSAWWWVEEKIGGRNSALDGKLGRKILIWIWRSLIAASWFPCCFLHILLCYFAYFAFLVCLLGLCAWT